MTKAPGKFLLSVHNEDLPKPFAMVHFNLISVTHGTIDLMDGAPKTLSDKVLPTWKTNHAQGGYGAILLQELEVKEFSIHYQVFALEDRVLLNVKSHSPALLLFVAFKNDLHFKAGDNGTIYMKEGQFNIAYSSRLDCTASFEKIGEYQNFGILFPVDYLREFERLFPFLTGFLNPVTGDPPVCLLKEPGWISAKIYYVLNEFLECDFTGEVRHHYFETLIKELLLLLLMQTQKNGSDYHTYMQNLYEAKYMIEKNPGRHFTISDIAVQVGLKEARLKNGFRQAFGIGISEYMAQVKMQKAYIWVVDTEKPFKEIARLTGYTSLQNFLTAFKRYFNATPGSIRKYLHRMQH